jgi:hypothetical protein
VATATELLKTLTDYAAIGTANTANYIYNLQVNHDKTVKAIIEEAAAADLVAPTTLQNAQAVLDTANQNKTLMIEAAARANGIKTTVDDIDTNTYVVESLKPQNGYLDFLHGWQEVWTDALYQFWHIIYFWTCQRKESAIDFSKPQESLQVHYINYDANTYPRLLHFPDNTGTQIHIDAAQNFRLFPAATNDGN